MQQQSVEAQKSGTLGMNLACWARNVVYLGLLLLLLPYLLFRSLRTGRYRTGFRQKLWGAHANDFGLQRSRTAPVVWLHGVSVGEVQLLVPLLERLREQYPMHRFVLSVTTTSGMTLAQKSLPDVECFYFPFDFSWAVARTMSVLQPKLIVLAELELWPNFSCVADRHDVPVVVINGRLSKRSYRGYRRFSWLTRGVFRRLAAVGAQTQEYAERFIGCGADSASVVNTGNVKFDNVELQRDAVDVGRFRSMAKIGDQDRVLMLGSSQVEEETTLLSAFPLLLKQFPGLRLVIVPRHPERFEEVFAACQRVATAHSVQRLVVSRRSRLCEASPADEERWDVLLVDSIGELRWWWGLADVAIVGGSFGSRGGQNMLEPAAYGCNVAFGPNTSNFRDVVSLLLDGEGADEIPNLASIAPWITQQLAEPLAGKQRGRNARELITRQQGATQRTLELLAPFLNRAIEAHQECEQVRDQAA